LVRAALAGCGLSSVVLSHLPADGKTTVGDHVLPRAWEARTATLDVLGDEPRRIADYRKTPHSLFVGSAGTGSKGEPVEAELIVYEADGGDKADLKGKVVFTGSDPADIWRHAARGGAIGIVADWSRTRYHTGRHIRAEDFAFHPDNARKLWGFSISEHEGRMLREQAAAGGKRPLRVRAAVNARLYEGRLEQVTGMIAGSDANLPEVVLFAALYRPGAFDNAAAVGCALEIARGLQHLIKHGQLARPRRTIRFLFGAEGVAPLSYLIGRAGHAGPKALPPAGLAISGVGLDESRHPYCYARSPEPTCPAADIVLDRVLHHPTIAQGHAPGDPMPYNPEHAPAADPVFGVSFPTLTQSDVPAELHAGSLDTADTIDPASLKTAATAAAATLYFLASAGSTEAAWMAQEIHSRTLTAMAALVRRTNEDLLSRLSQVAAGAVSRDVRLHELRRRAARRLTFQRDRCYDALGVIGRFAADPAEPSGDHKRSRKDEQRKEAVGDPFRWTVNDIAGRTERAYEDSVDSIVRTVDLEVGRLTLARGSGAAALGITADLPVPESFQEHLAGQLIPWRSIPGLPTFQALPEADRAACRWGPSRGSLVDELLWADGTRSIRDIHRLIELQHGKSDLSRLMEVYTYLASTGHVEFTRKGAPEFTREQLVADLRALGVPEGKPLVVHSLLSSLGYVVGGAVAVLDSLQEVIGEAGTLVMPTFTRPTELFLPDYTPCAEDLLPEFLRFRSGALRSIHPTHSIAALGKDAAAIIEGHRKSPAAAGADSPLHRAARKGGWVLLLGVGHERNTTVHVAEALAEVPYRSLPYSAEFDRPFRTLLPDGTLLNFEPGGAPGCSRHFETIQPALEAAGKVKMGRVGPASCRLMKAEDVIDVVRAVLEKDATALLCRQTSCPFCHRARAVPAK
jgi:aminoglycoside 3-N-acetyltransferase